MLWISRIEKKRVEIGAIPAIYYTPIDVEPCGTVIHYHGWSSQKENHDLMASTLCAAGFQVLVPDGLYHGERGSVDYEEDFEKILDVILQSIKEFPLLYAWLEPKELAITGHSMGSMIAAGLFHNHPSIAKAAVINGYCNYKEGFKDTEAIPEELLELDPMNHLDQVGNRKLLVLHGDADSSVSIDIQRDYVERAKKFFLEGHLQYEELPNLNHYITLSMLQRTIEFLRDL